MNFVHYEGKVNDDKWVSTIMLVNTHINYFNWIVLNVLLGI
jgi:hypothetical protein